MFFITESWDAFNMRYYKISYTYYLYCCSDVCCVIENIPEGIELPVWLVSMRTPLTVTCLIIRRIFPILFWLHTFQTLFLLSYLQMSCAGNHRACSYHDMIDLWIYTFISVMPGESTTIELYVEKTVRCKHIKPK